MWLSHGLWPITPPVGKDYIGNEMTPLTESNNAETLRVSCSSLPLSSFLQSPSYFFVVFSFRHINPLQQDEAKGKVVVTTVVFWSLEKAKKPQTYTSCRSSKRAVDMNCFRKRQVMLKQSIPSTCVLYLSSTFFQRHGAKSELKPQLFYPWNG